MIFTLQLGFSTMTLLLSLLLIGWQSWAFWVVGLLTVLQMIFSYLLPKYLLGWKKLAKQGILIVLGFAGICVVVQMEPVSAQPLFFAIFVQSIVHIALA